MQEENNKQRQNQSNKTKDIIKKDIKTQQIEGERISYSIVEKTSKSGFSKNSRVLFLVHGRLIAYVNEIPSKILLPFEQRANLPQFKHSINLEQIEDVSLNKSTIAIKYTKNKQKLQWQFLCPSVQCSKNWQKRIKTSIQAMKDEANNKPQNIVIPQNQAEKPVENMMQQNPQQQQRPENTQQINPNNQNMQQTHKNAQQMNQNQQGNQQMPSNTYNNQNNNGPQSEYNNIQNSNGLNGLLGNGQQNNKQHANQSQMKSNEKNNGPDEQNVSPFAALVPKKQVSKPTSSLFVGSVQVQSEKDQQILKSKIQSIGSISMRMRGQYQKRKQQQKNLKQQIRNQEPGILGDIFKVSMNTKLQIQKLNKEWGYQFAKGHNQFDIVYDFKIYAELVTKKIIDQLGLQPKKRYYQPTQQTSNVIRYEINGVIFSVFLTQLKQISSFDDKGTIVSNQVSKMAQHQFKNYNYVLKLTHNKGKIRVPLCCFMQYKGFSVLAQVIIPEADSYDNMQLLQKQLEILQAESRINNSIFEDGDFANIVALQGKAYQKLARAQNIHKKFDFCYIESLKFYLPQDYNNFSKGKPYQRLRQELIQDDQCQQKILYGEDMCSIADRLKFPQHFRDGMEELTEISKTIYDRINLLVEELQNIDSYFSNPEQLSALMHKSGINIRYLGVLLERTKSSWLKELLMSQICARCSKSFLNFDLQDCLLNLSQSNTQIVRNFQVKQIINFLNKMFGKSQETEIFWKQLNKQSQSYYRVSINKEQIHHGFILQALQIHCNFKLKNIDQNITIFSNSPFTQDHLASFQIKTKTYDLQFTQLYTSVKNLLKQETAQSYDQLRGLLNLTRTQNIPAHFRMSSIYTELMNFLVNWLPPATARDVYYPQQIQFGQAFPSNSLYKIKLAQVRWGLKNNEIDQSERVKEWIVDHINKWVGEAHPVLTDLYQIFANYYLMFKDQQKKAVNYAKSALRNEQKLVGANHQKVADNHYLLGSIYMNYGKKIQAINSLKKANQIIAKSQNEESQAFGQVCLKMGELYLSLNSLQQAIQLGLRAIQVLSDQGNNYSLIRAIELVCRCYQLTEDWESYFNLIESKIVYRVVDFIDEVQLTERIIKVTILPSLKIIAMNNSTITQKILRLMNELPETTRAPNMAYNFLKVRIQENLFPQKFLQILGDIQEVLQEIQQNGMIARWKGFQNLSNKSLLNKVGINMENKGFNFIASLEALNIFIGSSFVQGVLTEQ